MIPHLFHALAEAVATWRLQRRLRNTERLIEHFQHQHAGIGELLLQLMRERDALRVSLILRDSASTRSTTAP